MLAAACVLSVVAGCAPRPPAGSVRYLDDEFGFRAVRFEEPLSSFEDLEFVRDQKGLACYRKREEELELGHATVGYIHYCFYGDRLASVTVWGSGADTANYLLQELRRTYGRGQALTSTQGRAKQPVGEIWNGRKVTAVLLFAQRESYPQMDDSEVVVTLSSNRIMRKKDTAAHADGPKLSPSP